MPHEPAFHEANLTSMPIRDLGLTIAGTKLEGVIAEFEKELDRSHIRRLQPQFYLSTEWGVPFGTISIGIPWYLARPDLTALQERFAGYVEGVSAKDILRYLRHEMGHVVNYAYLLYESEDWIRHFGSITRPYEEDYRPEPFSRRFVRHLPGWYAQKHPDEDWAETFAVWMTPGSDWHGEYTGWPTALGKLQYCDRTMKALAERDPPVRATELDEDVRELTYSIEQFYRQPSATTADSLPGLDGALRTVFEEGYGSDGTVSEMRKPAAELIRAQERELMSNIFRWTGHFPERTRVLLRFLADRAERLDLAYLEDRRVPAAIALTTLVTALAMNYVHLGSYFPSEGAKREPPPKPAS